MPRAISSKSTCSAGSSTDAIAPEPAIVDISRERRQITRTPSSSDSAPATTAAAASPDRVANDGTRRTPYALIVAASATCMVNSVGWIRSIPVTVSGAEIALVTENPDSSGDQRLHLGDSRGEHRFGREQLSAHRRPLRTLPGEHPYRSPIVLPDCGLIRNIAVGDLAQTPRSAPQGCCNDGRAHRPVRTPARQCIAPDPPPQRPCVPPPSQPAGQRFGAVRRPTWTDSGKSSGAVDRRDSAGASPGAHRLRGPAPGSAWTLVPENPYDDTAARRGPW